MASATDTQSNVRLSNEDGYTLVQFKESVKKIDLDNLDELQVLEKKLSSLWDQMSKNQKLFFKYAKDILQSRLETDKYYKNILIAGKQLQKYKNVEMSGLLIFFNAVKHYIGLPHAPASKKRKVLKYNRKINDLWTQTPTFKADAAKFESFIQPQKWWGSILDFFTDKINEARIPQLLRLQGILFANFDSMTEDEKNRYNFATKILRNRQKIDPEASPSLTAEKRKALQYFCDNVSKGDPQALKKIKDALFLSYPEMTAEERKMYRQAAAQI